ncbi:diamine acetyltransferase [Erysipelothrix larvae]|uniref:Diamine acetyltransferase n=1 Tax=Erysipelothrix larvae TaxID=1514105 RepID=A0A0X8H0H0_9FIRM|nr:GNAT family protein [Erysipelothrix larvae]AMC93739.1 diamine acetyltransferase [Erysipelothrix larvae]
MLKYEKFTEKHIPLYYEWRNDPEVAKYDQSGFLRPMSYEEVEVWSQRMISGPTFMVYEDDKAIGTCAFMNLDERNRHAELAIVIGDRSYWNKGYGKQIMKQLMDWGFEGLNLERLYLHVFDFNIRAIKLYESLGFRHEGTLRNMLYRSGTYHNVLAYGYLRSEYREEHK